MITIILYKIWIFIVVVSASTMITYGYFNFKVFMSYDDRSDSTKLNEYFASMGIGLGILIFLTLK